MIDQGWSLTGDEAEAASFLWEPRPGGTIDIGRITTVYPNPCSPGGDDLPTVKTPLDVIDALRAESFMHLSEPMPISINGVSGLSVDASVDPSVLAACDPGSAGVAVFPLGGTDYTIQTGQLFKLQVLDVGGSNVAFVVASKAGPDISVAEIETFFGLAKRMIDSVEF